MIKKEQMMNRHQIGYIYGELVNIWSKNLDDHIASVKKSDEYKALVKEYLEDKEIKEYTKERKDKLENITIVANLLKTLLKINKEYTIAEKTTYNYLKSYIDSSAREYIKDSVKFEKEFNETTDSVNNCKAEQKTFDKLKLNQQWLMKERAYTEMKSRLALIPIGDHDDIVKTILEEVTIEKVIEFVNA